MNVLHLLFSAVVPGLGGCAHTPDSAAVSSADVLRTAASQPAKVAMTVERLGEKALSKLAEKTDGDETKPGETAL